MPCARRSSRSDRTSSTHAFTRKRSRAARHRARIDALGALRYEPIVTIWLGYPSRVDLPGPIARLDDAPGPVGDRPTRRRCSRREAHRLAQMLAVVISASGPHMTMPHEELARATDAQLRRLSPSLPACAWSFVITEKRATYACTPDRPRARGPALRTRRLSRRRLRQRRISGHARGRGAQRRRRRGGLPRRPRSDAGDSSAIRQVPAPTMMRADSVFRRGHAS